MRHVKENDMRLKLSQIRIDGGTQGRDAINQTIVSEYNHALMNGAVFPPVDVFFDGISYYLVDGFHRYFAHKSAVAPDIEANIHTGTLRDAQLFSFGVNDDHGMRRNPADRRKVVVIMLRDEEWGKWSDREIAKRCKVSHPFVAKIREELFPTEEKPAEKKFTNKQGNVSVMKTGNIGKKKEEPAPEIDTEFGEEDKVHELELNLKDLADENAKLNDRLAVKAMEGTAEEKQLAGQTIEELRQRVHVLEAENDALKASLSTQMSKNAEMVKQLMYYKKRVERLEKAAA